ncbi:MAG: hypothetical protein NTV34_11005 [Proteobacteria bacterium]|nr:hypothetical protein [Pseudomonadota bacterium]
MSQSYFHNSKSNSLRLSYALFPCIGPLALSLILALPACQTPSGEDHDNSKVTGADEFANSLLVAASYLDGGRPDKAMNELQTLLAQKPNNIDALNLMGITQLALRNPRRAVLHLEKAWGMKKASAIGVNLSSAYYDLDRNRDAEKIINVILARKETPPYPHRERIFHNYGLIAEKTGRGLLAEKMFQNAVEQNPMFHISHMQLARIYKEKNRGSLVSKHLEAARFGCPACFEPLESLVKFNISKGETKLARLMIQDYKLTEGLSQQDRRRLADLESYLKKTSMREIQDDWRKSR